MLYIVCRQLTHSSWSQHSEQTIANTNATTTENKMSLGIQKFDEGNGLLDEDGFRSATTTRHKALSRWKQQAWIAVTALNILLACISSYTILFPKGCNSQSQGWDTELADARSAIEYERRLYTGALTYSPEKGGVTRLNDGEMEFFGPPSATLDESWKYLLHGM
jgi:hypothetical protein